MNKMNLIKKLYEREANLRKTFEEAAKTVDSEKMKACGKDEQALLTEILAEGETFGKMLRLYREMKERGNKRLDLKENYDKPEKIIEMLKEFGVTEFTFSSTWSNAMANAWVFTKLGFKMSGMLEINGEYKNFTTGDYEKAPAILFTL